VALLIARKRPRTYLDLDVRVVNMRQHLAEVAHVEPLSTAGTLVEMIGLGFGDAIGVDAVVARHLHL
jgi:hypothetical protein